MQEIIMRLLCIGVCIVHQCYRAVVHMCVGLMGTLTHRRIQVYKQLVHTSVYMYTRLSVRKK